MLVLAMCCSCYNFVTKSRKRKMEIKALASSHPTEKTKLINKHKIKNAALHYHTILEQHRIRNEMAMVPLKSNLKGQRWGSCHSLPPTYEEALTSLGKYSYNRTDSTNFSDTTGDEGTDTYYTGDEMMDEPSSPIMQVMMV